MSIVQQLCSEISSINHRKGAPTWEHLADVGAEMERQIVEFREAIRGRSLYQARLALANLLIDCYGIANTSNIDVDGDIEAIHEQLLDSLDENPKELARSTKYYTKMGMVVKPTQKMFGGTIHYLIYLAEDYDHPNGGVVPANKLLPAYGKTNQLKLTRIPSNVIRSKKKYDQTHPDLEPA